MPIARKFDSNSSVVKRIARGEARRLIKGATRPVDRPRRTGVSGEGASVALGGGSTGSAPTLAVAYGEDSPTTTVQVRSSQLAAQGGAYLVNDPVNGTLIVRASVVKDVLALYVM